MKLLKISFFIVSVFVQGMVVFSTDSFAKATGGQPGAFLSWGAGARSLGMGKAFVSVCNDSSATYWNPAGLSQLDRREVMFLHAQLWEGTIYDFITYIHPTTTLGTFGGYFTRLYSGGFEKIEVRYSNGEIVELVNKGTFSDTQMAISGSYGKKVEDILSLGTSLKIISHTLDTHTNGFITLDASMLLEDPIERLKNVKIGMVFQNLISLKTGEATDDKLPINFRIGASYKVLKNKLNLAVDIDKSEKGNLGYHIGIEYWMLNFVALRLGLDKEEVNMGFGVRYKDYGIDYALAMHELGGSHRLSASWHFGSSVKEARTSQIKKYYGEGMQAYRKGQYMLAMEKLAKSLSIQPRNRELKSMVTKLQVVVANIPLETGPSKESELIRKGIINYIEGDIKTAVNALRYAFTLKPEDEKLRQLLKQIESEAGLPTTGKIVTQGMNFVEQKLYQAVNHFYEGKYDLVITECQEVLNLEPKNPLALMRLGSAFYAIGQKQKARQVWEKLLEIQPDNEQLKEFLRSLE